MSKGNAYVAVFGTLLAAGIVQAQPRPMPQTYSFSAVSEQEWPRSTRVNRNGSMELVEAKSGSGDLHLILLYDFQAHKIYTRDLIRKTCTVQKYESRYSPFDPIGGAEEMGNKPRKFLRTESVNGIRARVVEEVIPGEGKTTDWLEEKFGFPVKQTATMQGRRERVFLEIREISYAASPASLFVPPADCSPIGGVSSATGGHAEMQAEASVSATHEFGKAEAPEPAPAPAEAAAPAAAASAAPARGNVTEVRLRVVPERYAGKCPSPVKLVADITTDGPATVWYEFLSGAVRSRGSNEGTVVFKSAGTQQVTLEADYVETPQVNECLLIAAPVKEDGSHGPDTVGSEPASFNATCK